MPRSRRKLIQDNGDFPPGSRNPDPCVRVLRNVRTGDVLRRCGSGWVDKHGSNHSWRQINHWDPLYPGYLDITATTDAVPAASSLSITRQDGRRGDQMPCPTHPPGSRD